MASGSDGGKSQWNGFLVELYCYLWRRWLLTTVVLDLGLYLEIKAIDWRRRIVLQWLRSDGQSLRSWPRAAFELLKGCQRWISSKGLLPFHLPFLSSLIFFKSTSPSRVACGYGLLDPTWVNMFMFVPVQKYNKKLNNYNYNYLFI